MTLGGVLLFRQRQNDSKSPNVFKVTNKSSLRERKSVHIMKVRDEETVELQRR